MKITKLNLIVILIVGGLLLGASIHPSRVMALSNGSSDVSPDTTTTVPDANGPNTDQTDGAGPDSTQVPTDSPTQTTVPNDNSNGESTTPCDQSTSTDPSSVDAQANLTNSTTVNNCVNADTQSGDASVTNSSAGGDATTGTSSDTANVVNAVGSSGSLASGGLQTATENVTGDVNGNISVDPTNLNNTTSPDSNPAVEVNAANDTTVNNSVDLAANSGNANVSNNQVGGSATSGDAITEANIVNLLNSMVNDNQAFLDIINIYGNLNGNIVIPEQLISGLLADPSESDTSALSSAINSSNNSTINNQVDLNALSGNTIVSNNQVGGSATSGNATDNLNIYNFVNSEITGGNVLLVFVNVMGHWVGLLLNDPAGTTTAALGGQIQQDVSGLPATTDNSTNTDTINNTVNLNSVSGDATVAYNQLGGNATSGDASASANLVNIIGSQINLSGWLGILIINVFGTWNGSLVIQAPLLNMASNASNNVTDPSSSDPSVSSSASLYPVFFYPQQTSRFNLADYTLTSDTPASSKTTTINQSNDTNDPKVKPSINYNYVIGAIVFFAGILILGTERFISYRQKI